MNIKQYRIVKTLLSKYPLLYIVALILIFLYIFLAESPNSNNINGVSDNRKETKYLVLEIVDGDTIKVEDLGTIRMIGINTPETVDPRKEVECFGKEASEKTTTLLENQYVYIEYDNSQGIQDKYGRVLAYVFKEDSTFINLELIEQGYAYEYTYDTPYKYQKTFKEAQQYAEDNNLGLWSGVCD